MEIYLFNVIFTLVRSSVIYGSVNNADNRFFIKLVIDPATLTVDMDKEALITLGHTDATSSVGKFFAKATWYNVRASILYLKSIMNMPFAVLGDVYTAILNLCDVYTTEKPSSSAAFLRTLGDESSQFQQSMSGFFKLFLADKFSFSNSDGRYTDAITELWKYFLSGSAARTTDNPIEEMMKFAKELARTGKIVGVTVDQVDAHVRMILDRSKGKALKELTFQDKFWAVFNILRRFGYTPEECYHILGNKACDIAFCGSILCNTPLAMKDGVIVAAADKGKTGTPSEREMTVNQQLMNNFINTVRGNYTFDPNLSYVTNYGLDFVPSLKITFRGSVELLDPRILAFSTAVAPTKSSAPTTNSGRSWLLDALSKRV